MARREPFLHEWQHVAAIITGLLVVLATVAAPVGVAIWGRDSGDDGPPASSLVPQASSAASPSETTDGSEPSRDETVENESAPTSSEVDAGILNGSVLGRDLAVEATVPCGVPSVAAGSAWSFGNVRFRGENVEAYSCSMLSGGVGALIFDLAQHYTKLSGLWGFADDSDGSHVISVDLLADGAARGTYVITGTSSQGASVDVTNVRKLEIRLIESRRAGGSERASKPFVAAAVS